MRLWTVICICIASVLTEETRTFPENFQFGAATSSYQIEGAWNVSGKGENIWDHLTHTTNRVINGETGDIACDSYHKYKRDIEMLKELGVNFYRFSISWSRILPTGFANKVNSDGIEYYNNLIDELLANDIKPFVTIYHWDLPQPLQLLGGWTNPLMADYYEDYANIVFETFGDRVQNWLTFNEPSVVCFEGYGLNSIPPKLGMHRIGDYLCVHHILMAHARVYHLYDEFFRPEQKGKISMTITGAWHKPETNRTEDLEASDIELQTELGSFCHPIMSKEGDYPEIVKERIRKEIIAEIYPVSDIPVFTPEQIQYVKGTFDFFGLNHYTSDIVKMNTKKHSDILPNSYYFDKHTILYKNESWPGSASSWLKVVPWGFTKLLNWIKDNYGNPELIVFENGFPDRGELEDYGRIEYYHLYMNSMLDAIEDGCNITGYTVWSLMDNFEWAQGYTEKFGLYHVNFEDPERTRTPKASSFYYRDIIKTKTMEKKLDPIYIKFNT